MKRKLTMKQAQALCRCWRDNGDAESLAKAARLEAEYRNHPDYESDTAWLLRKQAGP